MAGCRMAGCRMAGCRMAGCRMAGCRVDATTKRDGHILSCEAESPNVTNQIDEAAKRHRHAAGW